ncbi:MAG: hypothetical protein JO040_04060 [Gemmatimonadetes bacterium]|nr:hypothetical protein [Gemmatimonadota bacterium]
MIMVGMVTESVLDALAGRSGADASVFASAPAATPWGGAGADAEAFPWETSA